MKVFIYHDLMRDPALREFNSRAALAHNLHPHLQYLSDFYELFGKYETTDPTQADYYFVPLFITGMQWMNFDPGGIIDDHCWTGRGNHILISTGDVGQRRESPYEMRHDANPARAYDRKYQWLNDDFILIALESINLQPQDIAILPYRHDSIAPGRGERDVFLSFVGKLQQPYLDSDHIRGGKLVQFKERFQSDRIVIGTPQEIGLEYHAMMARSVFTLCPAGYGRWSFRMLEALLSQSIPVILSDGYVLPFADAIDWEKYCYVVEESRLFDLPEYLAGIPASEISQKQRDIVADRRLFEKDFVLDQVTRRLEPPSHADIAIGQMRAPVDMQIICVDVTNKCDLACSNCTRLLANQDGLWEMTPENFRLALQSLKNYKGIIAMIGGNPCMHSKFPELCRIFREEVPNQYQRGLWTNNYFKHRAVIEETFGALNLNPHNEERANAPLQDLYNTMVLKRGFNGGYYTGSSDHAPLLTAVKDIYGEAEMWEKIAGCDINREWSAAIVQNKGRLRAYFCEVAAAFDLARGTDMGMEVTLDWWKKPIAEFGGQIKTFCPGCGAPARIKGHLDHEETDTYTESNADIARKKPKRKVIFLDIDARQDLGHKVTKYASDRRTNS